MHIIIPAAGKSLRFKEEGIKEPKSLIKISDKLMIEHVIEMFDYNDQFHLIFSSKQYINFKEKIDYIESISNNISINIIDDHDLGPAYSVLKIDNIPKNEEIIICYCDFYVNWNYKKFKRDVYGLDGAIPCFKGFHPASFGNTYYAYINVDKKNNFLELREKQSFTKNRSDEPASVGIYYFKNFSLFSKFANILHKELHIGKERYISLLFNLMFNAKLKIKITYVDKFICLGTPQDLKYFKYWYNYFCLSKKNNYNYIFNQLNLIPMSGKGDRFKRNAYRISKPMIPVQGKPMVIKSGKSLPNSKRWVFLVRSDDYIKFNLKTLLESNFNNIKIIKVKKDTSGQLSTCMLASDYFKKDEPLFIASADYETQFSELKLQNMIKNNSIDGIIWTYKLKNLIVNNFNAFAYCKISNKGNVSEIIEKKTISKNPGNDNMAIGSFWFRRTEDFIDCANYAFKNKLKLNNEYFVGNSINYLIKHKNKNFKIFEVDKWISFGNPFELDIFLYWQEVFYNNS